LASLEFGLDDQGFFVDADSMFGAWVSGAASAAGTFGPFDVIADGAIDFATRLDFTDIDADGDGKLHLGELSDPSRYGRSNVTLDGADAALQLEFAADLPNPQLDNDAIELGDGSRIEYAPLVSLTLRSGDGKCRVGDPLPLDMGVPSSPLEVFADQAVLFPRRDNGQDVSDGETVAFEVQVVWRAISVTAPAGTRFVRIELIGQDNSSFSFFGGDISAYFDGLSLRAVLPNYYEFTFGYAEPKTVRLQPYDAGANRIEVFSVAHLDFWNRAAEAGPVQ